MNFAIIPFDEQPEDFMDRVKAIDPEPYISQSPRVYFVRINGDSGYISKQVGFTDTGKFPPITGIVIPFSDNNYSGLASSSLWDYLVGKK